VGDKRVFQVAAAAQMEQLGAQLAAATAAAGAVYFLYGALGTGKTTLVRGFLKALGHIGPIKSPTFTLLEPYFLGARPVYHFDFYRIADPEELEYLGIRDYFGRTSICLVEWPERGAELWIQPDVVVRIRYKGSYREVELEGRSPHGEELLSKLSFMINDQ
jgi:tRNA threonylcarbamoyladenosine biosynthesis protein TsaE